MASCGGSSVADLRYLTEVTVRENGRLISGSLVRRTRLTSRARSSMTGFSGSAQDWGDAVPVPLPGGGHAFLLNEDGSSGLSFDKIVLYCFAPNYVEGEDTEARLRAVPVGGSCVLEGADLAERRPTPGVIRRKPRPPSIRRDLLVVAFEDERDPLSIYEVFPEPDRRARWRGLELVSIRLTRVDDDEPVTRTITQLLPWLNDMPFNGTSQMVLETKPPGTGGLMKDASLARRTSYSHFRRD